MNKATIKTIDIIQERHPELFKKYLHTIIKVCAENEKWAHRVAVESHKDTLRLFDLAHDISGLNQEDEHFLPRI